MMNNIKLKSFLILSFSILINFCSGVPCPSGCTCYHTSGVRCTQLQLSSIPSVSTNTTILDLRYNQIREIPSNAFEGLSQLLVVFLNENQIGLIEENAFNRLTSLTHVYLNDNRISKILSNIFQGLQKLQNIYLENNDISELNAKSFSNLPQLNILFLNNNKIKIIPQGSFSNLPNLIRLGLDDNPIECDCGLYSLLKQYRETNQQNLIELQCASPSNLAYKNFTSLEDNDFHCGIQLNKDF